MSHPIGAPVRVDLYTADPESEFDFFHGLFGWNTRRIQAQNSEFADLTRSRDGRPVGGVTPMNPGDDDPGSCWYVSFRVSDCDVAVARAVESGASVRKPTVELPGRLRWSMLTDPFGGLFLVVEELDAESSRHVVYEDNTASWFEYGYRGSLDDPGQFYGDLFGWTTTSIDNDRFRDLEVDGVTRPFGGFHRAEGAEADLPGHWTVMFQPDSFDAALDTALNSGAEQLEEEWAADGYRWAVLRSPGGAGFGIRTAIAQSE
ncbi:VOC family protein [Haloglycomyces albus]|uniref:VOC family protein n=1 Tax=Haloglycomyces albus TaxID=526067 RepID=UPI00046D266E|nr:VOC family protein [Haloglycomyces albus]